MSARGNGGRYEHYACSGRQKHGPKACRNERLPRHKLEDAVLQQLAALYRDSGLVADALAKAEEEAERSRPEIEHRLASIGAEIARGEHCRRTSADSTHLQARHPRGLRNVRKSGPCRDRTCDLGIKSPLLYQLS
jgi:hypothetical protein